MTINSDGFCGACRHWVLEYPGLICPWCLHARHEAAMAALGGADPEREPDRVLTLVQEELRAMQIRKRELYTIRARAARALLAAPNVGEAVKAAHRRLQTVERWAVGDTINPACKQGHDRAIHGYKFRGMMRCEMPECDGPKPAPLPRKTRAERNDPAVLVAKQQAHLARMADRAMILERRLDDLKPSRLRAPLPE